MRTIRRDVRCHNELLEEPSGVGAMPLDRTGIGHRLDDLILRRQRRGAPLGLGPHNPKDFRPCVPRIAAIMIRPELIRRESLVVTRRRPTTKCPAVLSLHRQTVNLKYRTTRIRSADKLNTGFPRDQARTR